MEKKLDQIPTITYGEQEAWERLSNELIFTSHVGIPLTPENVTEISEEIQNEFITLHEKSILSGLEENKNANSENKKIEWEKEIIASVVKHIKSQNERLLSLKPLDNIQTLYSAVSLSSSDNGYFGWGFTPKLALEGQKEDSMKTNCLGQAIVLGTCCKKVNINVEMGITPDHPYVIATIDGKKYLVGGPGEPKDLTDGLEEKDGYTIYRPQGENLEETQNRMIIIQDFNQAVLYQTLENFAVLSRLAEDEHIYTLPGSKTEGEKIATEHKDKLLATDWQELQAKLFPDLVKSFNENHEEWSKEIQRVKNLRVKQYKGTILSEAFRNAIKSTSMRDADFETTFPEIIQSARMHKEEIISYLRNGTKVSENVPEDLALFFQSVRETIEKEDVEARVILYNSIDLNLNKD